MPHHSARLCFVIFILMGLLAAESLGPRSASAQGAVNDREAKKAAMTAAVLTKVAAVTLAEDPTRAACVEYVEKLRAFGEEIVSYGVPCMQDEFKDKLLAVPDKYMDLLIYEEVAFTDLNWPAALAIIAKKLSPDEIRQRITANLSENPDLIYPVVRNGWCEEAKESIMERIASKEILSDVEFVAAVELKDARLYPKLHKTTIQSDRAQLLLQILKALPDYDLRDTQRAVLKRIEKDQLKLGPGVMGIQEWGPTERLRFDAALNGDIDSLAFLIEAMEQKDVFIGSKPIQYFNPRLAVISLINVKGNNQQIKAWFDANREQIVYDTLVRRYGIEEDF